MQNKSQNEGDQDLKIEQMIQLGQGQLDIEYRLYSSIDSKAVWLTSFLITGLSLILANFFVFFTDLLVVSIIFGILALGVAIYVIFPREFFIGSGSTKVTEKFWSKDRSLKELKKDVLSNLNLATKKNKKTIEIKNLWFKVALYLTIIFLVTFLFFLILNYELLR